MAWTEITRLKYQREGLRYSAGFEISRDASRTEGMAADLDPRAEIWAMGVDVGMDRFSAYEVTGPFLHK